jgi:hypothetical protein
MLGHSCHEMEKQFHQQHDAVFQNATFFWAALPGNICKVVAQHDQNTMTLDDMYQIATTTQREAGAKLAKSVTAVDEDSHSDTEDDDDEVSALQNQKSTRFATKNKKQFSAPQRAR